MTLKEVKTIEQLMDMMGLSEFKKELHAKQAIEFENHEWVSIAAFLWVLAHESNDMEQRHEMLTWHKKIMDTIGVDIPQCECEVHRN